MLVLGILLAITIGLVMLARVIEGKSPGVTSESNPEVQEAIAARIAPVAKVAVAGADNTSLNPPAAAPAVAAADLPGDQVYNQACVACHSAGVAGAPKFGDPAAWGPRIAQGMDTLHKHALEGYQGKAGYMPPKGGRTDLSDQSIVNAVDYIVAQSK
jgi:cytochrome c5